MLPVKLDVSKFNAPSVSIYPVPAFPSGVAKTKCVKYGGLYAESINISLLSDLLYDVLITPCNVITFPTARIDKFVKLTTGSFV